MSLKYDPMRQLDIQRWLAHSEAERIEAVLTYHRKHRFIAPNLTAHATFHVVVENQVALEDETPVQATLTRLIGEGLDRHDAVHAIGSALAFQVYDILKTPDRQADPNEEYYARLRELTAASWRASGSAQ